MAEKKGSIAWLKAALYSRKDDVSINPDERTPLEAHSTDVPVSWNDAPRSPLPQITTLLHMASTKKGWSIATKFLIVSFVFFILAAGAATYMFFYGNNGISPQNIDVQIIMPSVIDGGKPTTIQVLIVNRNNANLKLADLIINYPDGTRNATNANQSLIHERQSIGSISAGQTV